MPRTFWQFLALGAILAIGLHSSPARAVDGDKTIQSDEDDFSSTPYTGYGEFNEEEDENAQTQFFQYGRFFGVSLGLGFETADGNRGTLWQGGFPLFDFKLHYWFDFNFALDLGFYYAKQYFELPAASGGHFDVNMIHVGVDLKYYFDTKNMAAPISFASPYLAIGAGAFTKTQTSFNQGGQPDQDTSLGLSAGGGLEFTLAPRKIFLELEGKIHIVSFNDTHTNIYASQNIPDQTGNFYTFSTNILFTW